MDDSGGKKLAQISLQYLYRFGKRLHSETMLGRFAAVLKDESTVI